MIPTNEQINRLCAGICGHDVEMRQGHTWRRDEDGEIDMFAFDCDYHSGPMCERCLYSYCKHCHTICPNDSCMPSINRYCEDRNMLPELYSQLYVGAWGTFIAELVSLVPCVSESITEQMKFLATSSARLHCIAALRALGKWPEDWSTN